MTDPIKDTFDMIKQNTFDACSNFSWNSMYKTFESESFIPMEIWKKTIDY